MGTSSSRPRAGIILVGVGKFLFGAVAFVLLAGTLIYYNPQNTKMRRASAACPFVDRALGDDPRWDVSSSASTSGHVRVYGHVRPQDFGELRRRAILAAGDVPVTFSVSTYRSEEEWIAYQRSKAQWRHEVTASASSAAR